MQGAQLAEMEALYREEQVLRKKYFNIIEGKTTGLSLFSCHCQFFNFICYLYLESNVMNLTHVSDMKGKIRVYCRLRPLCEKEITAKETNAIRSVDEFTVEHLWKDDKAKQHMYDRVFDGNATQDDVFEDTKARKK